MLRADRSHLHQLFNLVPVNTVLNTVIYMKAQALGLDPSSVYFDTVVRDILSSNAFFYFIITGNTDNAPEMFSLDKSPRKTNAGRDIELISLLTGRLIDFAAAAEIAVFTENTV